MQSMAERVISREAWLADRAVHHARLRGCAEHGPTEAEVWRASVRNLSRALAHTLDRPEPPPSDSAPDPSATAGAEEARRHHARGLTLAAALGLLKCFREGYRDLLRDAGAADPEPVDRFFDGVEAGLCTEWCALIQGAESPALVEERDRYRSIFESLHEPALLLDPDGAVTHMNRAAAELFEQPPVTSGLIEPSKPSEGPSEALLSDILLTTAAGGGETAFEREIEGPIGPRRYRITARTLVDAGAPPSDTLLVFTDVTEASETQRRLRYRGELAQLVLDISTEFTGLTNERVDRAIEEALRDVGRFTGADSAYAFRFSDDGRRLSMTHLWHSGRLVASKARLQNLDIEAMPWWMGRLRAGEVVAVPSLDRLPDDAGAVRGLLEEQGIQAILDVPLYLDGEIYGFIGLGSKEPRAHWGEDVIHLLRILGQMVTNVMRRRRAEQAYAQERRLLRTVIDNLPDYIYVKDAQSHFVLSNAAHLRLMRRSRLEDVVGKTDLDMFPRTLAEGYYRDEQNLIRTDEALVNREETVIDERGHKQWVLTTKVPLHDARGRVTGLVGMSRNITERKNMEEALAEHARLLEQANEDLRRRNHDLDEFTYVASHDLQEPLRKLAAFSDLLREDLEKGDREAVETDLRAITSGALRMQRLVQDLLALSRSGRQKMELRTIPLDRCVDRALDALELRIRETSAVIDRPRLPVVKGDLSLLTQLYQNLIGNALKFHGSDAPRVELTAEPLEDGWQLGVRDWGIGIKPQYAEQVFAPFRRLHGRGEYEGTGIGLAICRRIVERHGGRIWAEPAPERGTIFRFTLKKPRQEDPL